MSLPYRVKANYHKLARIMTTLPEKGTKRLGVERNQNVITQHGVEGSDKRSRETYMFVICPENDEVCCSKYRHTPTNQHDVIYAILFPSPPAIVSVNPSTVSLATAINAAFLARVFVICSVILAYPLHRHLLLCKVKTQTSLAGRLKHYLALFIWTVARP
jgi:hypothetical protein